MIFGRILTTRIFYNFIYRTYINYLIFGRILTTCP